MNRYEIFKSEGGFRVCGGIWAGGPTLSRSPWFATIAEAEAGAAKMKERDIRSDALDIIAGIMPADLYPADARQLAAKMMASL